jgi:tetratricopeptide (TPR) repeat protein
MKYIYQICLIFIFSSGLSALDMTCPHGCDKDPEIYWDKQLAIQNFLYEAYPEGICQLHSFTIYENSVCASPFIEDWYTIEWFDFPKWKYLQDPETFLDGLCISRYVSFKSNWSPEEIPERKEKYFKVRNLAGFLATLSQLQTDADLYIQNEKLCFGQATRWYKGALKTFQRMREQGRTSCCSDGGFSMAERVEEKIKETEHTIEEYQRKSDDFKLKADQLQDKLNGARNTILRLHEEQCQNCIENHQWSGAFYNRGLLSFSRGLINEALEDIRRFMDGLKDSEKALLSSEEYLNEGIIQSEVNLYNDAIVSLSMAIQKDPNNKMAYFERAAAYFETGEFDLALSDYLASGMRATIEEPGVSFSKDYAQGLVDGIKKGIKEEFGDEFPVWSPILGAGLWALTSSPSPHAKLVSGVLACVAASAAYVAADQICSELKELVTNWDHLTQKQRGEISGYLIGKYGVDIFFMAGSAKMMKAYQDLKRANNVLTFEMMLLEESQLVSCKNRYKDIEKRRKDSEYIQKYFGRNSFPEQEIRDNLKKMGYQIPARPVGIPENYTTCYSNKGCGIKYVDPKDPGNTHIRIMPGNPNSSNPAQQQTYIIDVRKGKAVMKGGGFTSQKDPKAHISAEEYVYE